MKWLEETVAPACTHEPAASGVLASTPETSVTSNRGLVAKGMS